LDDDWRIAANRDSSYLNLAGFSAFWFHGIGGG
jgi:hypothetical protein